MLPVIYPVACHTDNVGPGSTFVAIKGATYDGSIFISQAIARGATTIVVAHDALLSPAILTLIAEARCTVIRVENPRHALAYLSAQAAGNPAHSLCIIGITGTKGKTTTAWLLAHLLRSAGYATALLSTVKNRILDNELTARLTTAHPDYLHQFFRTCLDRGVTHVIMEVAAQAVTLHRVAGIPFAGLIYTNFSREHLEFYATLEEYGAAKRRLLDQRLPHAVTLVNGDDSWCRQLLSDIQGINTFGTQHTADYSFTAQAQACTGMQGAIRHNGCTITFACPALTGSFNAANIAAAASMAHAIGIDKRYIMQALATFLGVPGRLERYQLANGALAIIDYAHNPSSFDAVLSTLRQLTNHLIVLFGAGGQRDAGKRPVMGAVAAQYADLIILTSDNPRTEDPATIVHDILQGIDQSRMTVCIELDRAHAIEHAIASSRHGSIIALLGKGTEEYQYIGTTKFPFNERHILRPYCA